MIISKANLMFLKTEGDIRDLTKRNNVGYLCTVNVFTNSVIRAIQRLP